MYVLVDGLVCDLSTNGPCWPSIPAANLLDSVEESSFVWFAFRCFGYLLILVAVLIMIWKYCSACCAAFKFKALCLNKAHKLHAGTKHPAFGRWLARCKMLGISGKSARRLWKDLLKGLQLSNLQKVDAANVIFEGLAQQVAKLCPDKMHREMRCSQPVLWSGSNAQTAAQEHGFTMEKCALGILVGDLRLLDDTQADAWETLRPAWVTFSRFFVNMAVESGHTNVVVLLSKSHPGTIFREEELPLLLKAGIHVEYHALLPTDKRLTLGEVLHLLQAVGS